MHLCVATDDDAPLIHRCLIATGALVHRRRCYEDSRLIRLADVQEMLAQPGIMVWLAMDGDEAHGFAAVSGGHEGTRRIGRLHFFVVRPDAPRDTAARLLDHWLGAFADQQVPRVRQARLDPVSGVFRLEQDRDLLDLFAARGFSAGEVAGNMEMDVQDLRWSESPEARGVTFRAGRADDLPSLSTLNRAEGLPHWDYHVRATLAADGFERMQVAEHNGSIIGYANFFAARWDSPLPEFGPLLVASAYRGMSIGRALTARAIQYAHAHGVCRVRLSTMSNHFNFYRALGFEVTVTWQEQLWKTF